MPGGRPVAPVASRVVKLIFTTKRLPLPAVPAPALAPAPPLLHDPLLNTCDSVVVVWVTLRSSWSVYCNPRTRLRNRTSGWVDCTPLMCHCKPLAFVAWTRCRGGRRGPRTKLAKCCGAAARYRAAKAPSPTTLRICDPRKVPVCHGCTYIELAGLMGFDIANCTR